MKKKRLIALVMMAIMGVSMIAIGVANADSVFAFEELNYGELVELYSKAGRAIWNTEKWSSVVVPIGLWQIEKDIPAGRWMIEAAENTSIDVVYGNKTMHGDVGVSYVDSIDDEHISVDEKFVISLEQNCYLEIKYGPARFTPKGKKNNYLFRDVRNSEIGKMKVDELRSLRNKIIEQIKLSDEWMDFVLSEGEYRMSLNDVRWWHLEAANNTKPVVYIGIDGVYTTSLGRERDSIDVNGMVFLPIAIKNGDVEFSTYIGKPEFLFEH